MNIRVAQAKLIVKEVASYEYPRIHGVSNLNALRDGYRVLRTILYERYQARHRKAAATDMTTGVDAINAGPEADIPEDYRPAMLSGVRAGKGPVMRAEQEQNWVRPCALPRMNREPGRLGPGRHGRTR
jgi:hypothetical protein